MARHVHVHVYKLKFDKKKPKRNPFIVYKKSRASARCKKTRLSVEAVGKIFKGIQKLEMSDTKQSRTQTVVEENDVSGSGLILRGDVKTSADELLKQTLLTTLSLESK